MSGRKKQAISISCHHFQEAEEEMELREAFRILDKENQGTISVSVLKEIIMVGKLIQWSMVPWPFCA